MTEVWLVWRRMSLDDVLLAAVCEDEATAERHVEAERTWLDRYHGRRYQPRWDQQLGARVLRNQYGEEVSWESQLVVSTTPELR